MTLKEWLESTGTTQTLLADKTGIPQALLSKYVVGRQRPHIDNAVAIEKETGGKVPVESWVGFQPIGKKTKKGKKKRSAA
jgi:hypothetical protein